MQVTNTAIDAAAFLIAWEQPVEDIRAELLARGLSEYGAYLAYKAARLLWDSGFYERRSPKERVGTLFL